jgi:hypothetical protein
MVRLLSLLMACMLLTGVISDAADIQKASKFDILGASVDVRVTRDGTTLPATFVPYLKRGDTIEISFPKGVQFSRSPRWHLIVAYMYDDYVQHPPSFGISDSDLGRAKAGYTWKVPVKDDGTPIIFLVPENGNGKGHGIPDARNAISELGNRGLLLRTASVSSSAQVKQSTLGLFLHSLSAIQPGEFANGREHVIAATQSLFGYDLGSASCFQQDVSQSTQYACAAQAVAWNYENAPKANVVSAVGSQLPLTAATYGMLLGALYELLAKRRVEAHYMFEPGVIKPGGRDTNVFVEAQPSYDASAANPSTIVYFEIGSRATSPKVPAYGSPPRLSLCLNADTLNLQVPFSGLPIYFRSHQAIFESGSKTFTLPASFDPLTGFQFSLSPEQIATLSGGASTVRFRSTWGFDSLESAPETIVSPHAAPWVPQNGANIAIMGQKTGSLTFTDGSGGMGSCVQSVVVKDATGNTVPVEAIDRTNDTATVHVDAAGAIGPVGTAIIGEANGINSTPVPVEFLPPMPQVTYAVAYLPKGTLILRGTGLKYINTVTLEHTGITFGSGSPNPDGSWTFTTQGAAPYQPAWEHQTMAISYTLQPPDARTAAVQADVQYAISNPAAPSTR